MTNPVEPVQLGFAERQNSPSLRRLLLARFRLYDIAVNWQIFQLVVVVLLPIIGAMVGILDPARKALVGALAVFITLFDVAFIDRNYRRSIVRAARGAELFDVQLFALPWNALAAGAQPSAEEIERYSQARLAKRGESDTFDWYPAAVARAPLHVARVICQRANVSYDSALRRHYALGLVLAVFAVSAAIFIFGLVNAKSLADVVVTALVPPAPILIWALREHFRQKDAADANDTIQKESEAVLNDVLAGGCPEPECTARSMQLQSALFVRRAANPLLFPGLYQRRRTGLEGEMDAGAEHWLAKAGYPAFGSAGAGRQT
jgi:hypothetical protein